jgi:hypothetical protein
MSGAGEGEEYIPLREYLLRHDKVGHCYRPMWEVKPVLIINWLVFRHYVHGRSLWPPHGGDEAGFHNFVTAPQGGMKPVLITNYY